MKPTRLSGRRPWIRAQCALIGVAAAIALAAHAADPTVDAARAARDKAKIELLRAQEAFDRADEAYINVLGGVAAARSAPAPSAALASSSARPRVVTFTLSGPRVQMINPLEYRARLIVDGEPGAWTPHASGAKSIVPAQAVAVGYEVQSDERGDALNPAWRTVCSGSLPPGGNPIIDVTLAGQTSCSAR